MKSAKVRLLAFACAASCALAAGATAAHANSAAVDYFRNRADRTAVPSLLSQDERGFYRDLFAAIDRKDWPRVQELFAQKPEGPLHQAALAEYSPSDLWLYAAYAQRRHNSAALKALVSFLEAQWRQA